MQLAQIDPTEENQPIQSQSWLDHPVISGQALNWEKLIFALIVILAIVTRFYMLEPRVMSHDETSHVYFSWLFYRGQGYAHDPVTHGPLQFHLVALSYFLFGDNDVSARIPAALFSIATVAFMWNYRRYLGRAGALAAAMLLTISPYMLYYGRYVRNEAFVAFFGVITLWAILRYFDTGKDRYLYWMTAATVFHFTSKETSYIYTAQALLFFGLFFIYRVTSQRWVRPSARTWFLILLILALLFFSFGVLGQTLAQPPTPAPETPTPLAPIPASLSTFFILAAGASLLVALYFLIKGYSLSRLRRERVFDLLIVLGTLVLPLLSPFMINFVGWKIPVSASEVTNMTWTDIWHMGIIIIPISLLAIAIGLWWDWRRWLINAGIFYGIFTVFYTTIFTNGAGFFTGLVGSLGYWLAQQAVNRGSQPWYYYLLLQVPIYEYLPALGAIIAMILGVLGRYPASIKQFAPPEQDQAVEGEAEAPIFTPTLALLSFWAITSAIAYSIAGEKMPWLTVHIALPLILLAGYTVGYFIEKIDWGLFRKQRGWLVLALLIVFLTSSLAVIGALLGGKLPFQGKSLAELGATSTFIISLVMALASGVGLGYLFKEWSFGQVGSVLILTILAFLGVLTSRVAFTASYINYDLATEFLVYAHSAPGDKLALAQIEDISRRLTGGLEMVVAYDDVTTYPFWWYLRDYTNQRFYGANPTRDLRDAPAILVGDTNYGKLVPIVGQLYNQFDYVRIWWPNQDYFGLTWERVINALRNPELRSALFQVWLNRDYTEYAKVTGKDMSLQNWYPSGRMRLYVRKDVANQLWNYGAASDQEISLDPYEGKQIDLSADQILGAPGIEAGQFQIPRNIATAPDGSLYIADSNNHRIQHLSASGEFLGQWGSFADVSKGAASGGTFNEPWGIAVDAEGFVYVADTWNYRIQKFTPEGEFITMWGYFGQAETPFSLWGPRGIAIDDQGNVFVTDTGNKRVVIYDAQGEYLNQFGSVGYEPGQFNEPVGIAIDSKGQVYIADTWNQRIQVFAGDPSGGYAPLRNWEVNAWFGQSLDNKPYLAVDDQGHIFATDPEGYRILEFSETDELIRYWGYYGSGADSLNLPIGISVDTAGNLWVADSANNRVVHYSLPEE